MHGEQKADLPVSIAPKGLASREDKGQPFSLSFSPLVAKLLDSVGGWGDGGRGPGRNLEEESPSSPAFQQEQAESEGRDAMAVIKQQRRARELIEERQRDRVQKQHGKERLSLARSPPAAPAPVAECEHVHVGVERKNLARDSSLAALKSLETRLQAPVVSKVSASSAATKGSGAALASKIANKDLPVVQQGELGHAPAVHCGGVGGGAARDRKVSPHNTQASSPHSRAVEESTAVAKDGEVGHAEQDKGEEELGIDGRARSIASSSVMYPGLQRFSPLLALAVSKQTGVAGGGGVFTRTQVRRRGGP